MIALVLISRESTYGDDEGNGERWLEVISWEPRAFLYHNFLVNLFLL